MSEIKFYNPKDIGDTILGITQIGKLIPFKTIKGVFISNPIINIYSCGKIVKDYRLGSGLILSGTNQVDSEKTLTLTLNGYDLEKYSGNILIAECSFFGEGDIEIIFKIILK
tara:strand:- start:994 stop:1329 length:336 start_codon:yes stop_codon:yes gene_type:complete